MTMPHTGAPLASVFLKESQLAVTNEKQAERIAQLLAENRRLRAWRIALLALVALLGAVIWRVA